MNLEPATTSRVRLTADGLDGKRRLAAFHTGNHFVIESRLLSDATGLDPVMLLILSTIAVGSVQRTMRAGDLDARCKSGEPLEDGHFRPMSRRLIAQATGLPRETVRRRVAQLIEMGFIQEDGRGVKSMNIISDPRMVSAVEQVLKHQVLITNALIAEGVFRVEEASAGCFGK